MTAPPPRRPWWRRKRTWAAVAVWLAIAYPFGLGPAEYAARRGWLASRPQAGFYAPVRRYLPRYTGGGITLVGDNFALEELRPVRWTRWYWGYVDWCAALAASD